MTLSLVSFERKFSKSFARDRVITNIKVHHTMNIFWTKIVVAVLFFVLRLTFGLLPIKLYEYLHIWQADEEGQHQINEERQKLADLIITLVHSFGGGVLFATCFLHMIPEVDQAMFELQKQDEDLTKYPFSQLLICVGFLMVYFVEEVAYYIISTIPGNEEFKNKVAPLNRHIKLDTFVDFDIDKASDEKETDEQLKQSPKKLLRCILITIALSFHAVFEGIAIGLQNSASNIWYLFVAVSLHSVTLLFCVGVELLFSRKSYALIFLFILVLSVMSPVGVFIGLGVTSPTDEETASTSRASALLEGLSTGTILYITFFEVLAKEKDRQQYRIGRGLALLGGFGLMALLQIIE